MRTIAALAVLCIAGAVHASPTADKERGKVLWRAAASEYDLGNLDAAIAKFEEAYRLNPDPRILYNLGQACRQAKRYEQAVRHYRTFLRAVPSTRKRGEVEQLVGELEALLLAEKRSDQRPPEGVEPAPTLAPPPPMAPPPPSLSELPAPAGPEVRAWYRDPLGWSLVAGGAATAGVGVGFLLHARSLGRGAEDSLDQARALDRHDSAARAQTAGGVLVGVGAALAIGGAVKLVVGARRGHVAAVVTPRSIAFVGSF